MIQQLNQDSVGIPKVKGASSIAMCLYRLSQRNAVRLNVLRDLIDVFRPGDEKTEMAESLNATYVGTFRELMYREVVCSGGEVNIIRIGLPFHPHTQHGAVESDRFLDVFYIEGDVSKA